MSIEQRKKDHLRICLEENVETGKTRCRPFPAFDCPLCSPIKNRKRRGVSRGVDASRLLHPLPSDSSFQPGFPSVSRPSLWTRMCLLCRRRPTPPRSQDQIVLEGQEGPSLSRHEMDEAILHPFEVSWR